MLNEKQLLLLSFLSYGIKNQPKTVEEAILDILREIDKTDKPPKNLVLTSTDDWRRMLKFIANDKILPKYQLSDFYQKDDLLAFVAKKGKDINVVFRGTVSGRGWDDNAICVYSAESPDQIAVREYVEQLPISHGSDITATGHSKGGNRALFAAFATSRVNRAVAFNSQGFSDLFFDKYPKPHATSLLNISASDDMVHGFLLHPKEVTQKYIKTAKNLNPLIHHLPQSLLGNDGEFFPEAPSHGQAAEYFSAFSVKIMDYGLDKRQKLAGRFTTAVKMSFVNPKAANDLMGLVKEVLSGKD